MIPATAMGSKPTGVSTEYLPPTLSGITNVLYPSCIANVRKAPLEASVMATILFLDSTFPTCSSSLFFKILKDNAGSVVVPDLDILMMPKLFPSRYSVSSCR